MNYSLSSASGSGYKRFCLRLWLLIFCLLSFTAFAADAYERVKSDIDAGRAEIALQTLQESIKQHPGDYEAWFLMGVAHARQQHYHHAIEAFRHVIELNPLLAEPHNNLAVIYNELGDVRAAVNELEQSLKKRPGYAIAEGNLGDLYIKLALQNYRSALEKGENPLLEKRYARLLQVRDPKAVSKHSEKEVAVADSFTARENSVSRGAERAVASVSVEHVEVLPKKLAVIDALAIMDSADHDSALVKVEEQQILEAVERWRRAWSSRDLASYFAAYAKEFQAPDRFSSFEAWQKYKQRVISSKSYIQVRLSDIQIELDDSKKRATIKFFQKFHSNSYNGDDSKILDMIFESGGWKIVKESSI